LALLYGSPKLAATAPAVTVAVFPCDRDVGDDRHFMHHVTAAARAGGQFRNTTFALGVVPKEPDVGYRWIEPDKILSHIVSMLLYTVRGFWEKPLPG